MVNYKGLMHELVEQEKTKEEMRIATGMSTSEIAKIAKGEYVTLKSLEAMCNYFGCTPEKLIKFEKMETKK